MEDDTHLPTKVSPLGTQANFSLSAFPTICFGATTLKDDGCVVSRRPLPPNFLTPFPLDTCIRACASGHRRQKTATVSTSVGVPPG